MQCVQCKYCMQHLSVYKANIVSFTRHPIRAYAAESKLRSMCSCTLQIIEIHIKSYTIMKRHAKYTHMLQNMSKIHENKYQMRSLTSETCSLDAGPSK